MQSSRTISVEEYIEGLPEERRAVMRQVRRLVLDNLPAGYVEAVNWGMICYEVPLSAYPNTYNGQPIEYIALAAQKNYYSLYLMGVYGSPALEARLRAGFERAGKKLDMGKSCLRFRSLEQLPLDVLAEIIASVPPAALIARHEELRQARAAR